MQDNQPAQDNLITTTEQLAEVCASCAGEPFICVDTEFHRERTYYPLLCLVQIATPAGEAMIDTLAPNIDLAPLCELLYRPDVLKVFHAAGQDLEIFYNLTGEVMPNCYDTQIAAGVCGFGGAPSLARLAKSLLGKDVDKSRQFSNWKLRPLSSGQLAYALADVTMLRAIYLKLLGKIDRAGRGEWITEEMEKIHNPELYNNDPARAWRRVASGRFSAKTFPVLKRVAQWWDLEARRRNVPRRFVLRDEAVKEIAQSMPASKEDMMRLRSANSWRLSPAAMAEIIEVVRLGKQDDPEEPPRHKPAAGVVADGELVSLMRLLQKSAAQRSGVSAALIASGDDIVKLVSGERELPLLTDWKLEVFGKDALNVLEGRAAIVVVDGQVKVVERGEP